MESRPAAAAPISIIVNERPMELPAGATAADLLEQIGLQRRGVAVEVNGEVVPAREWAAFQLKSADHVEVVALVGGG